MPAGTYARIIIVTKPLEDPRTLPVEIGTVWSLCYLWDRSSVNTLETNRQRCQGDAALPLERVEYIIT